MFRLDSIPAHEPHAQVLSADLFFRCSSKDPAGGSAACRVKMASSADEGEISDNGGGARDLKATSLPYTEGSGVDPRDRTRNRYSSPEHDARPRRSRSRSPRGYKRTRDDRDHYADRRDQDSRHYRAPYQNPHNESYRRSRVSYDDLDRPPSRGSELSYSDRDRDRDSNRHRDRSRDRDRDRDRERDRDRYSRDGRDRYQDKRPRNRSRSPRGSRRDERANGKRFVKEGHYDRRDDSSRHVNGEHHVSSKQAQSSVSQHTTDGVHSQARKDNSMSRRDTNRNGASVAKQRYVGSLLMCGILN